MKRHTEQTRIQALGQYHTKNADTILKGFEKFITNKTVIDPCAGSGDLLEWAVHNGAIISEGYDIDPAMGYIVRDTLLDPPDYTGYFVVSNPPYLSRNKAKKQYAEIYDKYKQNDLYKCHLASLIENNCQEGIEILPSNFLCESKVSIRNLFFQYYEIIECKYWAEQVFPNVTTGITAFYFRLREKDTTIFPITMFPENVTYEIELKKKYGYLYGDEFFDYIHSGNLDLKIKRTIKGDPEPNTHFILSLMDKNEKPQGLSYNEDPPIYSDPKAFTTYQLTIPDIDLTEEMQRKIIKLFNSKLNYYRNKYHGLFLSNYLGADQKILSVSYCNKLLNRVIEDLTLDIFSFGKLSN